MTELDIDWVRSQFPAFAHPDAAGWAHLENAGGSYVPRHVIDILTNFYTATKVQPYVAPGPSTAGGVAMDRGYDLMPATLNAPRELVHFGPSTTQNTYVLAHALAPTLEAGDEVVVTNQDHEANIGAWTRLASQGAVIREWQVDTETGLLDIADLEELLGERTKLVCVTHTSNVAATVNPIAEISALVHSAGSWMVVDGVGHAPHAAIDVEALGCDVYLYSTYKTFGPHLGLMYTGRDLLDSVANQGHYFNESNPTSRLTPAGPNHAEIAASAGIIDYYADVHRHHFGDAQRDTVEIVRDVFELFAAHEAKIVEPLTAVLADKPVRLVGATPGSGAERAPTVAFTSERKASREVWDGLADQRVACAHGNFYARRLVEALGIDPTDGVVRLSLVHYNTSEEVQRAAEALDRLL